MDRELSGIIDWYINDFLIKETSLFEKMYSYLPPDVVIISKTENKLRILKNCGV